MRPTSRGTFSIGRCRFGVGHHHGEWWRRRLGRVASLPRYVLDTGSGQLSTTTSALGTYASTACRHRPSPWRWTIRPLFYGKATGQLTTDGQNVVVNFTLDANTIYLPTGKVYDADGYPVHHQHRR
ncbi:MAG: hypothetical protein QM736_03550 [Vicinamibacterales bacterium]